MKYTKFGISEEIENLSIKVEKEIKPIFEKIDEICEKTGRNRNEVLQMCLEFAIDNIEIER